MKGLLLLPSLPLFVSFIPSVSEFRLEMLGDSFLKFISSQELFRRYPKRNQGFLTALRSDIVSNANLHTCMANSPLSVYLRVETLKDEFVTDVGDGKVNLTVANVQTKLLADMAEALTAVFYIAGDVSMGQQFLTAIGVDLFAEGNAERKGERGGGGDVHRSALVTGKKKKKAVEENNDDLFIPEDFDEKLKDLVLSSQLSETSSDRSFLFAQLKSKDRWSSSPIMNEQNLHQLESALGYSFRDPMLLIEALTHSSMLGCPSNERLEFFGDAVLDFCVVAMLYDSNPHLKQGGLTINKHNIVNNKALAKVAIRLGLHKYLMHKCLPLEDIIDSINKKNEMVVEKMVEEGQGDSSEKPEEVNMKFLADAFEAVIAAIYIDCGDKLEVIHGVVAHLQLIPNECFA